MVQIPLILGGTIGSYALYSYYRGNNSKGGGVASNNNALDETEGLSDSIGWPYFWAKGSPATPWTDGPKGVDCSGYAQMALVRLGILSSGYADRGARALSDDSDPIIVGSQEPGDLAYYGGHVMVVCGYPKDDGGHSAVIGATGGGSLTFGTDPKACVKIYDSALYWSAFICYMRLKDNKR